MIFIKLMLFISFAGMLFVSCNEQVKTPNMVVVQAPNGEIILLGQYNNGIPNGTWIYKDVNGSTIKTTTYFNSNSKYEHSITYYFDNKNKPIYFEELDSLKIIKKIQLSTLPLTNEGLVFLGKILFQKECSSCHNLVNDLVGPGFNKIMATKTSNQIFNYFQQDSSNKVHSNLPKMDSVEIRAIVQYAQQSSRPIY